MLLLLINDGNDIAIWYVPEVNPLFSVFVVLLMSLGFYLFAGETILLKAT